MKAIVYLPLKPDVAKRNNLPLKLPVLAEDLPLVVDQDRIPLDVIVRGLEAQVSLNRDDKEYYQTYLQYFYYEKFKRLLSEKKYDEAFSVLEKAKSISEDYRYHFYRGLLLREVGREGEAEVELKISSSMNPSFSLPHYELGRLYMRKGEYEDAVKEFEKALQKDPDFVLPLVKMGDVRLSEGDLTGAIELYKKALEKEKNLPDVYNRLGVIENTLQRFEEAEKMFRRALDISPDYVDAQFNLASTLTKLGRHFEALEILMNLEKRLPEDVAVLNELGILMRELGLFEGSLERLERAYSLSKEDWIALNLARSAVFVDRDRAREILEDLKVGEMKEEAERVLEYLDLKNPGGWQGDIGEMAEELRGCDLMCALDGLEAEEEIGERIEAILDGFVPRGSEIDTVQLLDLATAYILSGEDFVEMERKAIEFSVAVYGNGVMMGVLRILLRLLQMRIAEGSVDVESFIESVVPEIQDLSWDLSLKVSRALERMPFEEPRKGSDFITSLLYFLHSGEKPDFYKPWIELLT